MNILVLTAHPDDAEFFAGGTLARAADQGHAVHILIATDGERGSLEYGAAELREIRHCEAQEAGRILGVRSVSFLGYSDGFLRDVPLTTLRERFIRAIRQHRADVVFTFDPLDVTDHPDHQCVAIAATDAVSAAGLPLYHPEHLAEGLPVQVVLTVYHFARTPRQANKAVDVSAYLERRIAALQAHASQMRFTVAEVRRLAELAGAPADLLALLDPARAADAIAMAIGMRAAAHGAPYDLEAAELFRQRESPLEPLFGLTDWRPVELL